MYSGTIDGTAYGTDAMRVLSTYFDQGQYEEVPAHGTGDVVELSAEAMRRYKNGGMRPMAHHAPSLEKIDQRISAIWAEIDAIWNSPLPDEAKMNQIGSRKNEIALLQAGQFEFARNGFYV